MTCQTGKRPYSTRAEADSAAYRQRHFVYKCNYCKFWHTSRDGRGNISSLPKLPPRAVQRVWEL